MIHFARFCILGYGLTFTSPGEWRRDASSSSRPSRRRVAERAVIACSPLLCLLSGSIRARGKRANMCRDRRTKTFDHAGLLRAGRDVVPRALQVKVRWKNDDARSVRLACVQREM